MTKLGKLLALASLCMMLTDCAVSPLYPIQIVGTAATGQQHSTTIVVQFIGLKK